MATVDPYFPLYEWDELIPQSNITLNLLRVSRSNPNLYAYCYVFVQFDFNTIPLAPPGTKSGDTCETRREKHLGTAW